MVTPGRMEYLVMHYAVKKLQSMMTFCLISELKAVSELDAILTELKIALFLNIVMNNINDVFIFSI